MVGDYGARKKSRVPPIITTTSLGHEGFDVVYLVGFAASVVYVVFFLTRPLAAGETHHTLLDVH